MKLYDLTVKDGKGNDVNLSEFKDKVLLVVNTATGCGFTPQYSGLQELYDKYKSQGFEILDFPCNQFANQAPGSNEEIGSLQNKHGCILPHKYSAAGIKGLRLNINVA